MAEVSEQTKAIIEIMDDPDGGIYKSHLAGLLKAYSVLYPDTKGEVARYVSYRCIPAELVLEKEVPLKVLKELGYLEDEDKKEADDADFVVKMLNEMEAGLDFDETPIVAAGKNIASVPRFQKTKKKAPTAPKKQKETKQKTESRFYKNGVIFAESNFLSDLKQEGFDVRMILSGEDEDKQRINTLVLNFPKDKVLTYVNFETNGTEFDINYTCVGEQSNLKGAIENTIKQFEKIVQNNFDYKYQKLWERQRGATCYLVGLGHNGLELFELNKLVTTIDDETLLLSYPDVNHDKVQDFLDKGVDNQGKLLLMYGKPGTGKTTYLRHLLSNKYDNQVVFMNASIFSQISSVNFVSFAISNLQNKLIVIEDAESLLISRGTDHKDRTTSISDLLNFTDGLIGDALNIKIIATFNVDVAQIDPALLRKGRLFFKQSFEELQKKDAIKLLDHLKSTGNYSNVKAFTSKAKTVPLSEVYGLLDNEEN